MFNSTPLPELTTDYTEREKKILFCMATENVELMHEYSPERMRMGRQKQRKKISRNTKN